MSLYAYSPDGTTINRTRGSLPKNLQRDLTTGEWSVPADGDSERFGWYPVTEVPQPDNDHIRTIENTGPGQFTEVWTFDQATADANVDQADRQVDTDQLKADLQAVKDMRDEAALERDAAALSKDQMTEGDPAFLNKWTPLDGSGSNAQRIAANEALTNNLLTETLRQYADHRKSWGTIRELSAIVKRILRVLRLDQ